MTRKRDEKHWSGYAEPQGGKEHPSRYSSLLQWESALSAHYGGLSCDWPKWARDFAGKFR